MSRKFLHGFVPTDLDKLPEAALPDAFERMFDAVGIEGDLQPCLASRAQLAVVNGVLRIAFQFLGQPHFHNAELTVPDNLGVAFHNANLKAATRGALGADGRLPNGHAGNQGLVGNKANKPIRLVATACQRTACTADRGKFQKRSPFHRFKAPLLPCAEHREHQR